MNYVSLNGKLSPATEPVLLASNRGYRYGDGLFETMKIINGRIVLAHYHFERLFSALALLKMSVPADFKVDKLIQEVISLAERNDCERLGRVRLSVSRGDGSLNEKQNLSQWLIECWPLDAASNEHNEKGFEIGIYPLARKGIDAFSNLKSANFLPYVMAAIHAQENNWNDCLILNSAERIADATTANVFMLREGRILTPPLSEGCIAGVMRRHLLETLPAAGFKVAEKPVTIQDLEAAEEIFLSNAIRGISWVKQFQDRTFSNKLSSEIFRRFVQPIWE